MAFRVTAEPERFDEASEWFADQIPVTEELAEELEIFGAARAFTIAGVAQLDIVADTFRSLEKAIEDGTPFEDWQEEVEEQLTRAWGRRDSGRLETIFRNATQQSLNAGRWSQMNEPEVRDLRPYVEFDGIDDSRQTDICRACNGKIVPIGHPWLLTHSPQLHHRCRSSLIGLSAEEAERRGITTDEDLPRDDPSPGFGEPPDVTAFEPDRDKYPPELFAEFERKRDELREKAKRPRVKKSKSDA